MKADLYASSVGVYTRGLATAERVLEKTEAHAKATGMSEEAMLESRLAADMFPLRRQIMTVCDFAKQVPSRLLGLPLPAQITGDLSLAELRAEIAKAKDFLAGLKPEQFEGRDEAPVTFSIGQDITLPAAQYALGFGLMNFTFHMSMAYAIARHLGADIGKRDLFAGGL